MNKSWLLYGSILFLAVSLFLNFFQNHNKYPTGCDEFGYLQLSEELTGNSEREEFITPLIADLEKEGFKYEEYAWLILPHAYHIDAGINQPVNQYQPGTSIILSLLTPKLKQVLFPVLVLAFGFIIILVLNFRFKIALSPILVALILFFVVASFPGPFMSELSRINSLAFTFIPLLLAGFLLFNQPKLAIVLLLVCVNFRIANLILLPVFGFVYFYKEKGRGLFKLLLYGALALLPILIYNAIIFGNPFSLSYSSNDTTWSSFQDIVNNMAYYFDWSQSWFRYHLICLLLLLVALVFKQFSGKRFLLLLGLVVLNYSFFLIHKVQMNYYPYATLLILIGVLVGIIKNHLKLRVVNIGALTLSLIVLIIMVFRFDNNNKNTQSDISVFKPYDVVWGDMYASSSEYINKNRGMRYFAGTSRARIFVVDWLNKKGYQQAFIINDLQVAPKTLELELRSIGLKGGLIGKGDWKIVEL